ncbi:MAG: hypothetical protein JNG86_08480, partial [Verrucomicrobiaceae bacterium]|nr:hypothetical protein [Verrucomicrobiaceae bacterium]
DTPPIMPVLGATVALPTMGARPQLKPLPPPPGESPADDAPRIGARLPGRMELPEDADTMEGFSESTKQRRRAEKLMKESLQRTQQRLEHLKVEQNFSLAVVVALVAVALGCVAFIYASRWTWKLYLVALAAIGYGIGWLIRISGKGIDRRFGYLAGIAGVASVLLANTVAWHGGMESHLGEESEAAEADSAEYAQESPEEKAARLRREEISREQEENRQKLYEAEFRETMRQQIKDHPELYEPDALEKLDQSLAEAAEDEKEYDAELAAEDKEGSPVDTTIHAIGLTLLFFGPRSIVAYFIIGGAAWRAAFRHLSNKEASDLHRGSVERSPDTSHLTLRERVQQGMN